MTRILLASTSIYRQQLLARLGVVFSVVDPAVDETPQPGEDAPALVARLAEAKARSGAEGERDALVIGSDQVAVLDGDILGKPGDAATNRQQLQRAAGRRVQFHTGLCLLATQSGRAQVEVVPFAVHFRMLSHAQIAAYVAREQAFDCAGGFRCEGLGSLATARTRHHHIGQQEIDRPIVIAADGQRLRLSLASPGIPLGRHRA